MLTIILGSLALVCALGWLFNHIVVKTFVWYLLEKGIPFPDPKEWKEGFAFVIKHTFKDVFK